MSFRNIIPALFAVCLLYAQTAATVHATEHLFHEHEAACDSYLSIEKSPADHFQSHNFVDFEINDEWKMPIAYVFTAQLVFSFDIRAPPIFPSFI